LDACNPHIMRQTIPCADLQSANPLLVTLLAFVAAWAWDSLRKRGRDPHPVVKMSAGLIAMGIGFFVLTVGVSRSDGPVSPLWFIALYVWHSIGELFFEPIGQGLVITNVPSRFKALFLALWEATGFLAFLAGAKHRSFS